MHPPNHPLCDLLTLPLSEAIDVAGAHAALDRSDPAPWTALDHVLRSRLVGYLQRHEGDPDDLDASILRATQEAPGPWRDRWCLLTELLRDGRGVVPAAEVPTEEPTANPDHVGACMHVTLAEPWTLLSGAWVENKLFRLTASANRHGTDVLARWTRREDDSWDVLAADLYGPAQPVTTADGSIPLEPPVTATQVSPFEAAEVTGVPRFVRLPNTLLVLDTELFVVHEPDPGDDEASIDAAVDSLNDEHAVSLTRGGYLSRAQALREREAALAAFSRAEAQAAEAEARAAAAEQRAHDAEGALRGALRVAREMEVRARAAEADLEQAVEHRVRSFEEVHRRLTQAGVVPHRSLQQRVAALVRERDGYMSAAATLAEDRRRVLRALSAEMEKGLTVEEAIANLRSKAWEEAASVLDADVDKEDRTWKIRRELAGTLREMARDIRGGREASRVEPMDRVRVLLSYLDNVAWGVPNTGNAEKDHAQRGTRLVAKKVEIRDLCRLVWGRPPYEHEGR